MKVPLKKLQEYEKYISTIAAGTAKWSEGHGVSHSKRIPKGFPVQFLAYVDRPMYSRDGYLIGIERGALIACALTKEFPAFIPRECITVN